MSTKKLLLLFLPFILIFNNILALFIFYVSNQTAKSYDQVLSRMITYKNITRATEELVNVNYHYITNSSINGLQTVNTTREKLFTLHHELQLLVPLKDDELTLQRFKKLVEAFIEQEKQLSITVHNDEDISYSAIYERLNQLALFILEESYRLIGLELNSYQIWYKKLLIEMNNIKSFGSLLIIVNTILSLIIAFWISQRISVPIQNLVQIAKNIAQGKLDSKVPTFKQYNEFSILAQSFEDMQINIYKLIRTEKEAAEKDKQLTRMELEVLQSQINPHFLFNSLNALSKLALIEGAEKTSDLTVSLSNLFRYNLKQLNQPVTLRNEVEHAREYFYIQQARFRDRVVFELNIEEQVLDTLVPVLTLQPIIENIFVHGIEGMEARAIITLNIYAENTNTIISIKDNGIGMDEQTLKQLRSYHIQDDSSAKMTGHEDRKSTGIGTKNVFRRIELLYGRKGLIDITSEVNKGTTVTITIPTVEQEKINVPYINS